MSTKIAPFPPLDQDIKTDILIIGGGLAGLLCAYLLEQSGIDYTLIEADRICRGVSQNTTAKITSQHGMIYDKILRKFDADTARMYWEANETALRRYRQLCQKIDCSYETKDAYLYSVKDTRRLEPELAALERIHAPAKYVTNLPLPFRVTGAICMPDQAQFDPIKFAAGLSKGLHIYEQTAARSLEDGVIQTDRCRIRAEKIIVATHFPIFNRHGGYFLKMYQHRSYVLGLTGAPDVQGMYRDEAETGLSFRNYKDLLLLGGGSHRTGKQGGNWAELERFAKQNYPGATIQYRWATQDCMTLDGIPYIGQYSKRTANLYVATGFHKWGMTSAMVAALLLHDLVQGKDNPYADVFSPTRTVARPQLLSNVLSASANLLTPTTPRCPHMGCALKWNKQERSWDCPCHGSRFQEDGTLLDNPATHDLDRKQI